jgi:hypothetical protein
MEQELNYGIMPGETWQHYKGGRYKIITLANHPELAKLLEEQSEKEGMSKSGFIENILKEKINKKNE